MTTRDTLCGKFGEACCENKIVATNGSGPSPTERKLAFGCGPAALWLAIFWLIPVSNVLADTGLMRLWYDKPASKWVEALPIGNGRFGAMVFGGVSEARLQFNDDTLFTGEPHNYAHNGAVKYLPQLRQLLFEGKQDEAHLAR